MSQRTSDNESGVRLPSALWHWSETERVRFRQDCRQGMRPCPYISCEHHLLLQPDPENFNKWRIRGQEMDKMDHSCGLDLLEQQGIVPTSEPLQSKPLPNLDTSCEVEIGSHSSHLLSTKESTASPK